MTITDQELLNTNKEFHEKLPIEYRSVVAKYFKIVRQSILSEKDLDIINTIWEKANEDEKLSYWLEEVDFILCDFNSTNSQCENENEKDEEVQSFLSEHLEVLTNQEIKEREWKIQPRTSQKIVLTNTVLLCPDGSGFKKLTSDEHSKGETLAELGGGKCRQCGHPFREHRASLEPSST